MKTAKKKLKNLVKNIKCNMYIDILNLQWNNHMMKQLQYQWI